MVHVIETATSGRAKCRGCDAKIDKGELRFGERVPNMFGDGDMTLWFHPLCAAFKRPEPFLEALLGSDGVAPAEAAAALANRDALETAARNGLAHRRLPRVNGGERAPTGRARCRHCREVIAKDSWRIALVYFEEARFEPSGYVHAECAEDYFGTADLLDRAARFNPRLEPDDLEALGDALRTARSPAGDD